MDILNTSLNTYLQLIAAGHGKVVAPALRLFEGFISIEIALLGCMLMLGKLQDLSFGFIRLVKIAITLHIIQHWPEYHQALHQMMLELGMTAAQSSNQFEQLFNPSNLLQQGLDISHIVFKQAGGLSLKLVTSPLTVGILMFAGLMVVISFCWVALGVYITLVQFYVSSMVFGLLLAFKVCSPAQWVSQGVIQLPLQYGAKLFGYVFVSALSQQLFSAMQAQISSELNFQAAAILSVSSLVYLVLATNIANLAASLINGTPSMGAGNMVAGVAASAGGVIGSGLAGYAGVRALPMVGNAALNSGGHLVSMTQAGITGAKLAASGQSMGRAAQVAGAAVGAARAVVRASPVQQSIQHNMASISSRFKAATQAGQLAAAGKAPTGSSRQTAGFVHTAAQRKQSMQAIFRSGQIINGSCQKLKQD